MAQGKSAPCVSKDLGVLDWRPNRDEEASFHIKRAYECEVNVLQVLSGEDGKNQNIIKIIDHQILQKPDGYELFMLLELCPCGTLFDIIEQNTNKNLEGITDEPLLFKIINSIANGLRTLHSNQVAHRDLKIENVLKSQDGQWKLCDFGSCTVRQYNKKLTGQERERVEEEIEKVTTPIYRAPEQLDFFKGYKINEKIDIWALGCIMYTLMYHKPPFEPGQKLAQINGKFQIPPNPPYSTYCKSLLSAMFQLNPDQRPSAQQIWRATQLDPSRNLDLPYKAIAEKKENKEIDTKNE